MVAEVIIQSNAKELNKTFDYNVPDSLENTIKIGSRVLVPFGNMKTLEDGFVIGLKQSSEYKLKDISSVQENYIDENKIMIAEWMSNRYFCNIADCLKLMLPPGKRTKILTNRIKEKKQLYVTLKKDKEEIEKEAGLSQNGDKIVCTCFNVTENQIWEAIKVNGLKTVEEVTNYTKAGGACGRCKGVIKDIIETYLRKEGQAPVMTAAQKILKIGRVIDQQISPQLQKDGGDIELIDVEGNKVKVKLTGMCSGCKNATMTLKAFVESVLKDKVDSSLEVEQV